MLRTEESRGPIPHEHVRMCAPPTDSSPSKSHHPTPTHQVFPYLQDLLRPRRQRDYLLSLNKGAKAFGVETYL